MRNIFKFVVLTAMVVFSGSCCAENFLSPGLSFESGKSYEVKTNVVQKFVDDDVVEDNYSTTYSSQYTIIVRSVDLDGVADITLTFGPASETVECHGKLSDIRQPLQSQHWYNLNVAYACLNGKSINIKVKPDGASECQDREFRQLLHGLSKEYASFNLNGKILNRKVVSILQEAVMFAVSNPFQVSMYLPSSPVASGESWYTADKTSNFTWTFEQTRDQVGVVLVTGFRTKMKKSLLSRKQAKSDISIAGEAELDVETNIPNRTVLSTYRKQTAVNSSDPAQEKLHGKQRSVTISTRIIRL